MNRKIIAVIGGSETTEKNLKTAEEVGSLIAKNGAILITGGLGGVMEAASRGAKKSWWTGYRYPSWHR